MSTNNSERATGTLSDVIPGPQQPWHMSLPELGIALSLHEPGTLRSAAVEEELRRRLLRERNSTPRTPPTVAFLIGSLVTITAIQVGNVMRSAPTSDKRASTPSSQMSERLAYSTNDVRRD